MPEGTKTYQLSNNHMQIHVRSHTFLPGKTPGVGLEHKLLACCCKGSSIVATCSQLDLSQSVWQGIYRVYTMHSVLKCLSGLDCLHLKANMGIFGQT